ncbi:MAG TPA: type II toxin-antitoxin system HicA family toxin [Chloroflexota bacterium]|nr:type II toxin-antitoxin system HicA family toxin [Chloroflexota bacterium]
MSRWPRVTGAELIRALARAGFAVARRRGSHNFVKHADGRATVVPVHAGEMLGPGLLQRISRDLDLSREELQALLRK